MNTTLINTLFIAFCLCFFGISKGYGQSYIIVKPKSGDGIYSILRAYNLSPNSCNLTAFSKLNDVTAKDNLIIGKKYMLPIKIEKYNGKSIRTTLGIKDLTLAKKIQKYNRKLRKKGLRKNRYEKSKELLVPVEFIDCNVSSTDKDKKQASRTIEQNKNNLFPIFGKKYQKIKIKDQKLKGRVFYLVAGHGGPDPGAVGEKKNNQLCEDEYAYDVILRLARNIITRGGTPYVIVRDTTDGIRDEKYLKCDKDEVVWGNIPVSSGQRKRLEQRSNIINKLSKKQPKGTKSQHCIVVHVDSRHEDNQTDLFFYHQNGNRKSKHLSKTMLNKIKKNYAKNNRKIAYKGSTKTRNLHMLREVNVPTVYIELGNIKHTFDQKRVLEPRNRQALANWFTEGIIKAL